MKGKGIKSSLPMFKSQVVTKMIVDHSRDDVKVKRGRRVKYKESV